MKNDVNWQFLMLLSDPSSRLQHSNKKLDHPIVSLSDAGSSDSSKDYRSDASLSEIECSDEINKSAGHSLEMLRCLLKKSVDSLLNMVSDRGKGGRRQIGARS